MLFAVDHDKLPSKDSTPEATQQTWLDRAAQDESFLARHIDEAGFDTIEKIEVEDRISLMVKQIRKLIAICCKTGETSRVTIVPTEEITSNGNTVLSIEAKYKDRKPLVLRISPESYSREESLNLFLRIISELNRIENEHPEGRKPFTKEEIEDPKFQLPDIHNLHDHQIGASRLKKAFPYLTRDTIDLIIEVSYQLEKIRNSTKYDDKITPGIKTDFSIGMDISSLIKSYVTGQAGELIGHIDEKTKELRHSTPNNEALTKNKNGIGNLNTTCPGMLLIVDNPYNIRSNDMRLRMEFDLSGINTDSWKARFHRAEQMIGRMPTKTEIILHADPRRTKINSETEADTHQLNKNLQKELTDILRIIKAETKKR